MFNWRKLLPSLPDYPDNPLFRYEIRQVRWAETPARLRRYSIVAFMIVLVLTGMLWSLFAVSLPGLYASYLDRFIVTIDRVVPLLFLMSLVASVALDMACILMTANSFLVEVTANRWDLLRLSTLSSTIIVEAKYALALCRTWRFTVVTVSLRIAVILFSLLWSFTKMTGGSVRLRLEDVGYYGAMSLLALIFVAEPGWQARSHSLEFLARSLGKSSFERAVASGLVKAVARWFFILPISFIFAFGIAAAALSPPSLSPLFPSWGCCTGCLVFGITLPFFYGVIDIDKPIKDLTARLDHELTDSN